MIRKESLTKNNKMWNPEIYQKAIKFAGEAHADQLVPGTKANYLLHLSNVAMEILLAYQADPCFDINLAIPIALLHDTIEDSDCSAAAIETVFGVAVANGVIALTKNESLVKTQQMPDSLARINQEKEEVGMVKLADRITNLQSPPAHWPKEKRINYRRQAMEILTELKGKNSHLEQRLADRIKVYEQFCH